MIISVLIETLSKKRSNRLSIVQTDCSEMEREENCRACGDRNCVHRFFDTNPQGKYLLNGKSSHLKAEEFRLVKTLTMEKFATI